MPSKKHSSDIEQLLTEQTAGILEAVDARLSFLLNSGRQISRGN